MYTKDQAIKLMNTWGGQQLPFFFMIDFELQKPVLYLLDDLPETISFDINGIKRNVPIEVATTPFRFEPEPTNFETYKTAFDKVMSELNYGNSYLLNLTFPTPLKTNLDLTSIFCRSSASYKLLIKNEFVVFSPEAFVKINNGKISSYPMKGTIDASIPSAEEKLFNDTKEKAEHATIVDLIRNDLSKIASNVSVVKYKYIEKLSTSRKHLLQMSSKIEGELPINYQNQLGDIIFSLLPAGSISGAPKKKTIEIITSVENTSRGYFTGVMGIFDGSTLDSSVMIRFIEQKSDKLVFRSGGGITSQSNAKTEYEELLDKVYVPFN